MKRAIILVLVIVISLPLFINAEEFTLRNGIKWGMNTEELKELMRAEGYEPIKEHKGLGEVATLLMYENVLVAGLECHMILLSIDKYKMRDLIGLQMVLYARPGYSLFESHHILEEFDIFLNVLQSKYGKPMKAGSFWKNNDYKGTISEATAAQKGLFQKYALWDLENVNIELRINAEVENSLGEDIIETGSTVWVGYYSKIAINMISNTGIQEHEGSGM